MLRKVLNVNTLVDYSVLQDSLIFCYMLQHIETLENVILTGRSELFFALFLV